jgi:hypothetical protein
MGKGYAEGPAAEAAEEERERLKRGDGPRRRALRRAVFGSTAEEPKHFLGWADEVDADALFASGAAWGIHVAPAQVGADGSTIG